MLTLALPLRMAGSRLATVETDSDEEIAQSVALLLDTRPGERRSVPEYGLPDPLFSGVDLDVIADVVDEWEPRATPLFLEQLVDGGIVDIVNAAPRADEAPAGGFTPPAPPAPAPALTPIAYDVDGRPYLTPWAELPTSGVAYDVDGTPFMTDVAGDAGASVAFDVDGVPYVTTEED